ncbi:MULTISPECIES: pantoate--beta-alanine ligase [Chromohalobacter]|uniref:Pantothenate synthetase n=1 Tax=Chromohalobacter israelensis (strain ATCC BAA-138 / DSM 3043 / CIP 106854 / NCIMB 13768 / 1H11) TaxID=290398 RepID=PANC_CHRI1|nr:MULTISPECIES: pantoate--beta-alanine ligase [Chromohalobacter]Q1QSZ8.1 RecName: Full=Pantothenate synthetase; Short=PS; AltName: Full=Pantoate--beta-alanine ligase; AltName: Full=Pantoate-activating enzyme [Chromohalobacter salexigens DSM 3043]ABE60410.1 pantothenate synthetase [Chromohalobacter salexigens DSM 3043]MDF9434531.1 pantoate--beta-alanine ligase [Chromohalobacter israelensis]MDO0945746.1 pantoate--beta-alanine ligase [Chromohalobacter salexigens]
MLTLSDIGELRNHLHAARRDAKRIALVPTMGNLHAGHLALVDAARRDADVVVATIFVNPLQFGANEDFASYPRTLEADAQALASHGCDLVFTPRTDALYPHGLEAHTQVSVPDVSEGLCGANRPGHFTGVATVVSLLFNLVQPDAAYFGRKDYQQFMVIRKLVADLHFPIEIVGVPTQRAEDGLALSSRNGYLSAAERQRAPALYRTLCQVHDALRAGEAPPTALRDGLAALAEQGFKPDYLELRRAQDLGPIAPDTQEAILLVAAHLGTTRLIDNLAVSLPR